VIRSGKSRFTLATLPAKEFPGIGEISPVLTMMVDADRLKGIIKDTEFAMANQDVRYYLNGLLLEIREQEIRACATDGHRLAMNGLEAATGQEEPHQIILPRKGVGELLRMLEGAEATVELRISQNHLQARLGQWTLTSKLIDGRFPDYERLILQKGNKVVIADRERLKQGLARTAIISTEKFRGVRIALEQDLIRASANNTEREEAEEEIEVDYTGEGLEIGFNVSYMLDALAAIKTESVRLEFLDAKNGCLIRPEGDGASGTHVIMPIRL
jgi:DNA polymerase-3 subunit beta